MMTSTIPKTLKHGAVRTMHLLSFVFTVYVILGVGVAAGKKQLAKMAILAENS